MEPTVAIAIPLTWPYVPTLFFYSMMFMNFPPKTHILRATTSALIDRTRNVLVDSALEMECTHVLFLDADMSYPRDIVSRLLAHDKDIVGALCFGRYPPYPPMLSIDGQSIPNLQDIRCKNEVLIPVEKIGTGCLMIKTDVFNEVQYPWFEITPNMGEDWSFCVKARGAGFDIFVDTTLTPGHLQQITITEEIVNLYQKEQAPVPEGLEGQDMSTIQDRFYKKHRM